MNNKLPYDLLVIEDNYDIKNIIAVFASKNNISIRFAKNTAEFFKNISKYEFKVILCDLNLDYKHEGFFILRMYTFLKNGIFTKGCIYAFTSENISSRELLEKGFDGKLNKDFKSIISFLKDYFTLGSIIETINYSNQIPA